MEYARGILVDFGPVGTQYIVHFLEDVEPPEPGLFQSLAHDVNGYPFGLQVHLNGVDPIGAACDFKVHIPQMVFSA